MAPRSRNRGASRPPRRKRAHDTPLGTGHQSCPRGGR
nr:MAG TPA: hypothetical protein [Caudoviricetes sp.]